MKKSFIHISKFLSLVLRHKPEVIGLSIESGGWAEIDELVEKANQRGFKLDKHTLKLLVQQSEKPRFAISEDSKKIRANYGHSIDIELEYTPKPPPEFLYHGTVLRYLADIQQVGLQKRNRNYVHLSIDKQTAEQVGRRHGEPIVLTIKAHGMFQDGYAFYYTPADIWLTQEVPPQYILLPDRKMEDQ